jgi:hypothetical protein
MQMIRAGEIEQKKYGFGLSGLEIALVFNKEMRWEKTVFRFSPIEGNLPNYGIEEDSGYLNEILNNAVPSIDE